ncbi:MAG: hypothetical protein M3N08_03620 [Pseudomonadota bacterium]|nr:hypothetical protein [Pseudomonadota bacterium]
MDRLKNKLEALDEAIFALEDKVGLSHSSQQEATKKQIEQLKESRAREAKVLAAAQKVASRLDQTIEHLENALRA